MYCLIFACGRYRRRKEYRKACEEAGKIGTAVLLVISFLIIKLIKVNCELAELKVTPAQQVDWNC